MDIGVQRDSVSVHRRTKLSYVADGKVQTIRVLPVGISNQCSHLHLHLPLLCHGGLGLCWRAAIQLPLCHRLSSSTIFLCRSISLVQTFSAYQRAATCGMVELVAYRRCLAPKHASRVLQCRQELWFVDYFFLECCHPENNV
jgi:hypothetical protein